MKNLTTEEFDKAPPLVQFLHVAAISKIEVRNSIIKNAMVEYPEYFEDNIEREKKWASVPKDVRDAFIKRSVKPIHRFLAWMGCKRLTLIEYILPNSIRRCLTD